MKYKIGDHVKYDSGEWRFYGTVSAVVENSISPCYRIVVERMEKVKCGFSSMQFEFELEVDSRQAGSSRPGEKPVLPAGQLPVTPEPAAVQLPATPEQAIAVPEKVKTGAGSRPISDAWFRNLDAYIRGERTTVTRAWARDNTLGYRAGRLNKEKLEKLLEINFPFDAIKSRVLPNVQPQAPAKAPAAEKAPAPAKASAAMSSWDLNLQEYISGVKSGKIDDWAYRTRSRYRRGALPKEQIDKLELIGFDFNPTGMKIDTVKPGRPAGKTGIHGTSISSVWEQNLQAYARGERAGKVDDWARRNRRNYERGKLSDEKLKKLIEINFAFGDAAPNQAEQASSQEPEPANAWDRNMRDYLKGERTSLVNMWIFHNRKLYKTGKLPEDKFDKLLKINFPFDTKTKK
jgi:hypothetical protein